MPFTTIPLRHTKPTKKILFISLDLPNSSTVFQLAQEIQKKEQSKILWIDGNLGHSDSDKVYEPLNKVLNDKASLSKAIRHTKGIHILSGGASVPLSQKTQSFQGQFLDDLETLSENFDRILVSLNTTDKNLLELWSHWAEKIYLFFSDKNIMLEGIVAFLKDPSYHVDGLLPLGANSHQNELIWLRLNEIIPNLPKLILDFKKTAQ